MRRLPDWLPPHRLVLLALFALFVGWCAVALRWDWIPKYAPLAAEGLWRTIWLLVVTSVLGFLLAVPLGLAQASPGPRGSSARSSGGRRSSSRSG